MQTALHPSLVQPGNMWPRVKSWAVVCSLCAGLFNRAVLWSKTAGGTGFKLDNAHCQKCKFFFRFQTAVWVSFGLLTMGRSLFLTAGMCYFVKFNWNCSSVPRSTSTSITTLGSATIECRLVLRFVCPWHLGRREKIGSGLWFRGQIVCSGPFN